MSVLIIFGIKIQYILLPIAEVGWNHREWVIASIVLFLIWLWKKVLTYSLIVYENIKWKLRILRGVVDFAVFSIFFYILLEL